MSLLDELRATIPDDPKRATCCLCNAILDHALYGRILVRPDPEKLCDAHQRSIDEMLAEVLRKAKSRR